MVTHDDLEITGKRSYYISHQCELSPDCFPVCVLIVSSIYDLFGEECLRRLIEHEEPRNRSIVRGEPVVESEVSDEVVADPVLSASHAAERDAASRSLNGYGQLNWVKSDVMLGTLKPKVARIVRHQFRHRVDGGTKSGGGIVALAKVFQPRELSAIPAFSVSQFSEISSDVDTSFEFLADPALEECDSLASLTARCDRSFLLGNGIEFNNVFSECLHERFAARLQTFNRSLAPRGDPLRRFEASFQSVQE